MSLLQRILGRRECALAERQSTEAALGPGASPPTGLELAAAHLTISCPEETAEDIARDQHRKRGQFLARQERWSELSEEVDHADRQRLMTPARMPVAELLCCGARADVVAAVEHALIDGRPDSGAPLLTGIEGLEAMLAETPRDRVRAVIVALAHIDLGWAWRGFDPGARLSPRNLEAFETHFERARTILTGLDPSARNSPLYLSALCSLKASSVAPHAGLSQDYEALIGLNPKCPGPMRSLGTYKSPRWHGSHKELELEARSTAARTSSEWGAAGYTWVMFDAMLGDPVVCAQLDTEFFVEGVDDILVRMPNQHTANMLAAYCALTIGGQSFADPQAEATREKIASCADGIVRNHLTQLHPLIWAQASTGFGSTLRVSSQRHFAANGRTKGLCKIAELFGQEIAKGNRIVFTDKGPVAEHV